MRLCLAIGTGPAGDLIYQKLAQIGVINPYPVVLLVDARRTQTQTGARTPREVRIKEFDLLGFAAFLTEYGISHIAFVGDFTDRLTINQKSFDIILSQYKKLTAGAQLMALTEQLSSLNVQVVHIRSIVNELAPVHNHLIEGFSPECASVFASARHKLKLKSSNLSAGTFASCISGLNGTTILPETDERTDELLERFSRLPNRQGTFFLCRHSPWPHAEIFQPTIGIKTIQHCIDVGISGILADRAQIVTLNCRELAEYARSRSFHLEYFD